MIETSSEFNESLVDVIFGECLLINRDFRAIFDACHMTFRSASSERILFANEAFSFIFCYHPERYEYGSCMQNRDILIKVNEDDSRRYSLYEIAKSMGAHISEIEPSDSSITLVKHHFHLIEKYLGRYLRNRDFSWEAKVTENTAQS